MEGIAKIFLEEGIPIELNGYPSMFSFAIGGKDITDQRSWNISEKDYYLKIVEELIDRGIMPDHDPREPWFLCYSHSENDIDQTLTAMRDLIRVTKN